MGPVLASHAVALAPAGETGLAWEGHDDQCNRIPGDGRRAPSPCRHVPVTRLARTALASGGTIPSARGARGAPAPATGPAAGERPPDRQIAPLWSVHCRA